jgi:hypothetical protein
MSIVKLSRLLGDRIYSTDPGYAGTTPSTAPSKILYFNFGTVATNNTISGVEYSSDIFVIIKYYNQDFQYSFDRPYLKQVLEYHSDGLSTSPPSTSSQHRIDNTGNPLPINSPSWPGNGPLPFHEGCTCPHTGSICPSHKTGFGFTT